MKGNEGFSPENRDWRFHCNTLIVSRLFATQLLLIALGHFISALSSRAFDVSKEGRCRIRDEKLYLCSRTFADEQLPGTQLIRVKSAAPFFSQKSFISFHRLIEAEHLSAGLAVWFYCEPSARLIFGDALGGVTADEVLKALRTAAGGLTRTELSSCFARNKSSSEINRALTVLTQHGLVRSEKEDATTGRPAERWFAESLGTKETNLTKELTKDGQ